MPFGLVPARGDWQYRNLPVASASTISRGSLVAWDGARNIKAYASVDSHYVGIAMNSSNNSLPVGFIEVAIPRPGCTAYADLFTGMAASVLSLGQAHSICPGNASTTSQLISFVTTLHTSVWSQTVSIFGAPNSDLSRIEVMFIQNEAGFYSTSSLSIV